MAFPMNQKKKPTLQLFQLTEMFVSGTAAKWAMVYWIVIYFWFWLLGLSGTVIAIRP